MLKLTGLFGPCSKDTHSTAAARQQQHTLLMRTEHELVLLGCSNVGLTLVGRVPYLHITRDSQQLQWVVAAATVAEAGAHVS